MEKIEKWIENTPTEKWGRLVSFVRLKIGGNESFNKLKKHAIKKNLIEEFNRYWKNPDRSVTEESLFKDNRKVKVDGTLKVSTHRKIIKKDGSESEPELSLAVSPVSKISRIPSVRKRVIKKTVKKEFSESESELCDVQEETLSSMDSDDEKISIFDLINALKKDRIKTFQDLIIIFSVTSNFKEMNIKYLLLERIPYYEESRFFLEYFWKNPLTRITMDDLRWYSGKNNQPPKPISLELEEIFLKLRGKITQAELFSSLPIFDKLIKKDDEFFITEDEPDEDGGAFVIKDVLNSNTQEKPLEKEDKIQLIWDSLNTFYRYFSIMMSDDLKKSMKTKLERLQENGFEVWKQASVRIKRKSNDLPDFEIYFSKYIVINSSAKTNRVLVWSDFKQRFPNSKIKRETFYMELRKKNYERISHSASEYYGIIFTR